MSIISNTTVISNLSRIGCLDLLRQLYGDVFLSVEVYQEIQRGFEEGYTFYEGIDDIVEPKDGWLRLTALTGQEIEIFSQMPARLHAGEASSLAIAELRDWMLLTDDKAARTVAANRRIPLGGTLGCLLLGVERELWSLPQANQWLERMIEGGFYSPVPALDTLVQSD
jgi:predicted nucleic acid-binding protein